jgi:hypothetical protein
LLTIKKQDMIRKKLAVTIGIILTVAFFGSLIAALSSEEVNENRQKTTTEKEYNCTDRHAGDCSKEGYKSCCSPEKCREMKCDTSMCKHMGEKCKLGEKKCNPSECPHHANKCIKEEKKCQEACTKHADKCAEGEKNCDPATCTGKCPSKKDAGK